jgi:hypothetical protein
MCVHLQRSPQPQPTDEPMLYNRDTRGRGNRLYRYLHAPLDPPPILTANTNPQSSSFSKCTPSGTDDATSSTLSEFSYSYALPSRISLQPTHLLLRLGTSSHNHHRRRNGIQQPKHSLYVPQPRPISISNRRQNTLTDTHHLFRFRDRASIRTSDLRRTSCRQSPQIPAHRRHNRRRK